MKKYRSTSIFIVSLFFVETLFQVVFYSIELKYFDKYSCYENLGKVIIDSLYVIGTVKVVFFLPLYFLVYLVFIQNKAPLSAVIQSIFHATLFLLLYILLSIALPGNVANKIVDTSMLTVIAFFTSFFILRLKRN